MLVISAADLAGAGVIDFDHREIRIQRAALDSREVQAGDLFVCLQGEKTDGHLFVQDAVKRGAVALLIDHTRKAEVQKQLLDASLDITLLPVHDVVQTLQSLASIRRQSFQGVVFAVVGSNGKTSTKEVLGSLLRCRFQEDLVFTTPGNWNNHIGLPLTLLSIPETCRFVVLELGMNHPGEIDLLARIAQPHHCVVPSIGYEHMEFFSSIEEVAAAELEVLHGMKGGVLVYPSRAPGQRLLADLAGAAGVRTVLYDLSSSSSTSEDHDGIAGRYDGSGFQFDARSFSIGEYKGEAMASNIMASVLLLEACGYGDGLEVCTAKLHPVAKGRFRTEQMGSTLVVDDTYNANPDSFRQAIRSMREMLPSGRILCIAGHMAELGHFSEEGHRRVGEDLAAAQFAGLLVCGQPDVRIMLSSFAKAAMDSGKYFSDSESLSTYLRGRPELIDEYDGILVKGSRSARMERLMPVLREMLAGN